MKANRPSYVNRANECHVHMHYLEIHAVSPLEQYAIMRLCSIQLEMGDALLIQLLIYSKVLFR